MGLRLLYQQQLFERHIQNKTITDVIQSNEFTFVFENQYSVEWYCSVSGADYDQCDMFYLLDNNKKRIDYDARTNDKNPGAKSIFESNDNFEKWSTLEQIKTLIGRKIVQASGGSGTLTLELDDGSFLQSSTWWIDPFYYRFYPASI